MHHARMIAEEQQLSISSFGKQEPHKREQTNALRESTAQRKNHHTAFYNDIVYDTTINHHQLSIYIKQRTHNFHLWSSQQLIKKKCWPLIATSSI